MFVLCEVECEAIIECFVLIVTPVFYLGNNGVCYGSNSWPEKKNSPHTIFTQMLYGLAYNVLY